MNPLTGELHDLKTFKELYGAKSSELEKTLVPIPDAFVEEVKAKTLKERLSWLENFHLQNELAKEKAK